MFHASLQYLRYLLLAKTRYAVHSPFVYEFVTQVLPPKSCKAVQIARDRKRTLLQSNMTIEIEDFGAGYGGVSKPVHQKSIAAVLNSSARREKEGALLYRISEYYQPKQVLELGTNLGFSTLYQALPIPNSLVFTVEGATNLAKLSSEFMQVVCPSVQVIQGEFSEVLTQRIPWERFKPDQVLIDGNHRFMPTISYFETLLPRVKDGALFVFDDIHWSKEMTEAWGQISKHPQVTVSIDLFGMGLCWVRRNQAKEHFVIRF